MNKKWDKRFLLLSEHVSTWSKDPSTKVGAVIVDKNRRIVSLGYNGLPNGTKDCEQILNNRSEKYERVVHAEINAILFAKSSLKDCILYTTPFMPCARCASIICQTGIVRVISYSSKEERWKESFERTKRIFEEKGIELLLYNKD